MLVVLSDIHFRETASDGLADPQNGRRFTVSRNLPPGPYRTLITSLAADARRSRARRLDLVLAGDILDLHRSSLWFDPRIEGQRPFVEHSAVGPELEGALLAILKAIAADPIVSETLEALRKLSAGRYRADPDDPDSEREFPVPVEIHYLPGNHDRLCNATSGIRRKVREILGIQVKPGQAGEPFPQIFLRDDPRVLVRHGQEYDRVNFAADLRVMSSIPAHLPPVHYADPTLGDFLSVELAARLPVAFRRIYGDEAIVRNPLLLGAYRRLLEVDNLRPMNAIFDFLLSNPAPGIEPEAEWQRLLPVARHILEEIHGHPFPRTVLRGRGTRLVWEILDRVSWLLQRRNWSLANARRITRGLTHHAVRVDDASAAAILAEREALIRSGDVRFVICGHTHRPGVHPLSTPLAGERYYIDTGTWRTRLPATRDRRVFGKLRTLSYVVVYRSDEDPGPRSHGDATKLESFDFWSGITRRWWEP